MKLKTYLNEEWDYKSPEYKLFMRYMDVRNKADKLASQMSKMDTELSKIQKQMKKKFLQVLITLARINKDLKSIKQQD